MARFLAKRGAANTNSVPNRLTKEEIEAGKGDILRLWNGQSIKDSTQEFSSIIQKTGNEGLLACGLDKVRVFRECFVPPIKEFFEGTDVQKIEKLLEKIGNEASIAGTEDIEMRDE